MKTELEPCGLGVRTSKARPAARRRRAKGVRKGRRTVEDALNKEACAAKQAVVTVAGPLAPGGVAEGGLKSGELKSGEVKSGGLKSGGLKPGEGLEGRPVHRSGTGRHEGVAEAGGESWGQSAGSSRRQSSLDAAAAGMRNGMVYPDAFPYEPPSPEESAALRLGPQQQTALQHILLGSQLSVAARAAGVTRMTLYRWLKHDANFQAAYNTWQADAILNSRTRLLAMTNTATSTLETAVQSNPRIALAVLRAAGILRRSTDGSTEPEECRRQIERRERRSRTAANEMRLTRARSTGQQSAGEQSTGQQSTGAQSTGAQSTGAGEAKACESAGSDLSAADSSGDGTALGESVADEMKTIDATAAAGVAAAGVAGEGVVGEVVGGVPRGIGLKANRKGERERPFGGEASSESRTCDGAAERFHRCHIV